MKDFSAPNGFTLLQEPKLKDPLMIMALPDTGNVGLRVVDYLKGKLKAKEFGRLEPFGFSTVPWVSVKDGLMEELEPMRNRFYFWENKAKTGGDLIIFKSEQPTARLYEYVELVLGVASRFGVKRLYLAGSFGAMGITHEDASEVFAVVNFARMREPLLNCGIKLYPEYKGIGTIHSSFLWFAKDRNIEAVSLWSPVPYYVARLPFPWSNYPQSSLAILSKWLRLEELPVDIADLESLAKRTELEMKGVYEQLHEESKKEAAHATFDQNEDYEDDEESAEISDDDLRHMMRDIEDFFNKDKE